MAGLSCEYAVGGNCETNKGRDQFGRDGLPLPGEPLEMIFVGRIAAVKHFKTALNGHIAHQPEAQAKEYRGWTPRRTLLRLRFRLVWIIRA